MIQMYVISYISVWLCHLLYLMAMECDVAEWASALVFRVSAIYKATIPWQIKFLPKSASIQLILCFYNLIWEAVDVTDNPSVSVFAF